METNNEGMCYYFAYGSNMDPRRMIKREITFGNRVLGMLAGYRLVFDKLRHGKGRGKGTAAANIIEDSSSDVYGAIYTCPEDLLSTLDKFEGVSSNQYYRKVLQVELTDSSLVKAYVYIANPEVCKDGLKIYPAYLEHLLVGKDILPRSYYDFLCSFEKDLLPNVPFCHYFAYGSDMNPSVLDGREIEYDRREPGYLTGYKRCFNKVKKSSGLAVANILPQEDSRVYGFVYKFYDSNPFERLDELHDVKDNQYYREQVTVELPDGGSTEAHVFIANEHACSDNKDIDPEHFKNIMACADILPKDYVDYLQSYC